MCLNPTNICPEDDTWVSAAPEVGDIIYFFSDDSDSDEVSDDTHFDSDSDIINSDSDEDLHKDGPGLVSPNQNHENEQMEQEREDIIINPNHYADEEIDVVYIDDNVRFRSGFVTQRFHPEPIVPLDEEPFQLFSITPYICNSLEIK